MQETNDSKWNFLLKFAQAHKVLNPQITIQEIANKAIEHYKLALSPEQARKVVSRLLNEGVQVNYLQTINTVLPPSSFTTSASFIIKEDLPKREVHFKHNKPGNYLVLGCWHVPFHNKTLHEGVIKLMEDNKFDGLILNGDFLDCNSLSGHDKGKFTVEPGLTLEKEYTAGKEAMDELLDFLPTESLKVYLYGNHEDRWNRYMADMQQAKTPIPSPAEGLGLEARGFRTIESWGSGYITLGEHLDILHGIYYNSHCAKTHIDRFRGSVLFAHTHRIQSYIEGRTGGFNIGWGGDLSSRAFNYADRGVKASWQNGFAIVNIDEQGNYYVNQIICIDGHFYYGNKRY